MDVSQYSVGVQEKRQTGNQFILYNHLTLRKLCLLEFIIMDENAHSTISKIIPSLPCHPQNEKLSLNPNFDVKYMYLRNMITYVFIGQIVWRL